MPYLEQSLEFQSPRQVSPSFQTPGKEMPRTSLEALWGSGACRAMPLKQHFRGIWEWKPGMGAEVWFALEPSQKNHNYPWGAAGFRAARNCPREQGWMELMQC